MKNIITGIIIGVVALLIFYLNYRRILKRKLMEPENKWLEYNRKTLGLSKKTLYNILGRGTELRNGQILYISELEGIGIVQNIYTVDKKDCIKNVSLKIRSRDKLEDILKSMIDTLGEPLLDRGYLFIWELDNLEYSLEAYNDSIDLRIRRLG